MENFPKQDEILAHWIYTKEEWQRYVKWKLMRKSWLHYFFHLMRPGKKRFHTEVKIGPSSVWTNELHEPFDEQNRRFRKILIHEAGNMNIMEISYENPQGTSQIRIPIPKGKLREAIALQEKMVERYPS